MQGHASTMLKSYALGVKHFDEFFKKMILLFMILSALSPALTETPLQQNLRGSANTWRVDLRLARTAVAYGI